MRLEAQQYPNSGYAVVRVIGPDNKVVMAESGDNAENARHRLLTRLKRCVEFGDDARELLRQIEGLNVDVKR